MTKWPVEELATVARVGESVVQHDQIEVGASYIGLEDVASDGRVIASHAVSQIDLGSSKNRFTSDDVLYGKLRPYLSKICCPDFAGVCSTELVPIRPSERVDKRFLLHFLRQPSMIAYATSRSAGANLPRVSPSTIASFKVPLPPLAEQRRIADILDRADDLRAKRQAAIDKLDSLTQAIFHDMFGDPFANTRDWEIGTLGEVAEQVRGVTYAKNDAVATPTPGYVGVLRAGNITAAGLDVTDLVYVPENNVALRQRLKRNDVLIAASSGSLSVVGKAARVAQDMDCGFGAFCKVLRPSTQVDARFFAHYFQTAGYRTRISHLAEGANINNLRAADLDDLQIPLPPLGLQRTFAGLVNKIQTSAASSRSAFEESVALSQSLQQQAFSGAL